jgi:hypothetical protein
MEWLCWIGFSDGAESLLLNFFSDCDSWFLVMIGIVFSKEQKDVDKEKLYEASWGGRR